MIKKELKWKKKVSGHHLVYVPTLRYGSKLWVTTRSWIPAGEMSSLCRMSDLSRVGTAAVPDHRLLAPSVILGCSSGGRGSGLVLTRVSHIQVVLRRLLEAQMWTQTLSPGL